MLTNKEKMLRMVLSNPVLQKKYRYDANDYDGFYEALAADNAVVQAIAKIIQGLDGSEDPTVQKRVYNTILNHMNENFYG